jgi:hypothetical protein
MKSFYWDIFLMVITYGILTYLSIRLMRKRKYKLNRKGGDEGGTGVPDQPIIPDLPDGVIWPHDEPKEELVS